MTLDEIRAAYASMSPEERREALPTWYTGDFAPSFPEWQHLYGEHDDTGLGDLIAAEMEKFERALPVEKRRSGIEWLNKGAAIQELVAACRVVYFATYHDWLNRNAPEGSRWRPHRSLSRNHSNSVGPDYDYADFPGPTAAAVLSKMGYPTWASLHASDFQKIVKPDAKRRPSKVGAMAHGLGIYLDRPIGTTAMRPVYTKVKRFYLEKLGQRAFRPEFPFAEDSVAEARALPSGRAERYQGEKLYVTRPDSARKATIKRDEMNIAAKFLSLVLKEVDEHFSSRQAGLVARAFYRSA